MNELTNTVTAKTYNNLVNRIMLFTKVVGLESAIWISSLIYLALFNDPFHKHFTICPLSNAGFDYCPGCGLGNSISFLFNGYFLESFNTHYLGIPAVIIIMYRIFSLIKFNLKKVKSSSH